MTAETLREAAALMRHNAETAEPGRWKTWGMDVYADPKGTSDIDDAVLVAMPQTPSTSDRRLHTGNTDHIASWHPAVAVAVADAIDQAAAVIEEADSGPLAMAMNAIAEPLVAVARLYLNEVTA